MSRLFGPIFQTCYLVEDIGVALDYWTGRLGVGPFFVLPPRTFDTLIYRGAPAEDHEIIAAVALAFSGDMQIELIVPGRAPSTYRDFWETGRRGVHHYGIATPDFDRSRQTAIDEGLEIVMEGASPFARFAYLEGDPDSPGTILELIEMGPQIVAAFESMRAAARHWDGARPIRTL